MSDANFDSNENYEVDTATDAQEYLLTGKGMLSLISSKSGELSDPETMSRVVELLRTGKTKVNLLQSRIVYEVRENELYKNWPGKSSETFEQWGMEVFEKKRAMMYALAKVYEVFIITYDVPVERLINIDFSKLCAASAHVTDANLEYVLSLCENNNLYNLQKILRNSSKVEKPEEEKNARFSFEVNAIQAETVNEAINTAKELVNSEIPGKIWEYICADFLCGASLETKESHLDRCVQALENAFSVEISVTPKISPVVIDGEFTEAPDES